MIFCNTNIVTLFLLYSKKDTCASCPVLFLLSAGEWKLKDEHNEQQLLETEEILAPFAEGAVVSGSVSSSMKKAIQSKNTEHAEKQIKSIITLKCCI